VFQVLITNSFPVRQTSNLVFTWWSLCVVFLGLNVKWLTSRWNIVSASYASRFRCVWLNSYHQTLYASANSEKARRILLIMKSWLLYSVQASIKRCFLIQWPTFCESFLGKPIQERCVSHAFEKSTFTITAVN